MPAELLFVLVVRAKYVIFQKYCYYFNFRLFVVLNHFGYNNACHDSFDIILSSHDDEPSR